MQPPGGGAESEGVGRIAVGSHRGELELSKDGSASWNPRPIYLAALGSMESPNRGNICHYEQIQFIFLMKNIPLNSFSLHSGSKYNQKNKQKL
ncbi:hypothetical protein NQ318_020894 [Aromia moschata]|uniref:Uncharacterized protein n=1 Tax=Aromia moschata TaxID=1265417 RepID=A0AAV8XYP0_9CUCU|nr:hypothetical protein NQ318_020894 [Aromia moschata]